MVSRSSSAQRSLHVVAGGKAAQSVAELSDEQIVDAIERNDPALSCRIYDRLIGVVDATLYRVLGRREHDHDDLVQTVFEQIVMTISRRKYAKACSLKAWAATVASHVALNALRSRIRERKVVDPRSAPDDEGMVASAPHDVERQVGSRRELEKLRGHLASMDQTKAMALLLHDALGHDLAEVAVLTGCSVAAAQSRLVRGRRELQDLMRRDAGPAASEDSQEGAS